VEVYHTVYESIKCVVLTDTYVVAGIVLSAALANNNVAGYTLLTTPNLNA
jgi:hypothetical protein